MDDNNVALQAFVSATFGFSTTHQLLTKFEMTSKMCNGPVFKLFSTGDENSWHLLAKL